MAYTRELAPVWLRGTACAMEGGVGRLGSVVAPLLGGIAATRWGTTGPFVMGGLAKSLASVLFLLGPKRRRTPEPPAADGPAVESPGQASGGRQDVGWGTILGEQRKFFGGACLAICGLTVLRQALSIMVPLLGSHIGLSVQQIGVAMSAGNTVDTIMFLPCVVRSVFVAASRCLLSDM